MKMMNPIAATTRTASATMIPVNRLVDCFCALSIIIATVCAPTCPAPTAGIAAVAGIAPPTSPTVKPGPVASEFDGSARCQRCP